MPEQAKPMQNSQGQNSQIRAQAPVAQAQASAAADDGEDVTYFPGPEDPHTVKWRGQEFRANAPKRIKDKELVEAARVNRFFHVGSGERRADPNEPPKTAMQYRAYVVAWMRSVASVEDLVVRWAADRVLRQSCEVGDDDIRYLGTLIEPKLKQMRMAEGLNDQQVAAVWIKHGILDLPWRA